MSNCNNKCKPNCNPINPYTRDNLGGCSCTYSTPATIFDATVVMTQVDDDFPFRAFLSGTNIDIVQNPQTIEINAQDSLQIAYDGGSNIDLNAGPVTVNTTDLLPGTQHIIYSNTLNGRPIHEINNSGTLTNGVEIQSNSLGNSIVPPGLSNNDPYRVQSLERISILVPTDIFYSDIIPPSTVVNYRIRGVLKSNGPPVVTHSFDMVFKAERDGAAPAVFTPGSTTIKAHPNELGLTPQINTTATGIELTFVGATNPGILWNGSLEIDTLAFTFS